jgi:hypothetical protein
MKRGRILALKQKKVGEEMSFQKMLLGSKLFNHGFLFLEVCAPNIEYLYEPRMSIFVHG